MKESETVGESCAKSSEESVWEHYEQMVPNNVAFVKEAKGAGRPIVGIYCEFTPRELILAAGGVPVCLCGTSEKTIPAAEVDLPTNLCPLIKSSYGFVVEGTCPHYEMADAVIAETTCDGKKKMFELIAQRRPTHQVSPQAKILRIRMDWSPTTWVSPTSRSKPTIRRRTASNWPPGSKPFWSWYRSRHLGGTGMRSPFGEPLPVEVPCAL